MKNLKLAICLAALAIGGWNQSPAQSGTTSSSLPLNQPLHEKFTTDAWTAFHAGEYATAITNADQCITKFGEAAGQIQAILESKKMSLPTGTVSEADQKRIASFQMLHDVALCFLIKGWAEEKLGHSEEARKAYTEAKKYTHARSSRPTGETFWSPAEKAGQPLPK